MSARPAALALRDVVKTFGRKARGLDGLSCTIPEGTLCGFVGPNGAGKTTTFSVVSGFMRPTSGTVDILGMGPFDPYTMRNLVGVLPQDAALSERHTPRELLAHLSQLSGSSGREARAEADRLLELVGLADRAHSRIAHLSHGMRRRVAVASALVASPRLVLLDEPLAGLDPVQAGALREALKALKGIQTLVISSHNLYELERMCDWVVMVDQGRCLACGPMQEITGEHHEVLWLLGEGEVPLQALREALPSDTLDLAEHGALLQRTSGDLDSSSLVVMELLTRHGIALRGCRRGAGLEARFIDATRRPA